MKVKELIAKLSELDGDLDVVVREGGKTYTYSTISDFELGSLQGEDFYAEEAWEDDEDSDKLEIDAVWIY